MLDFTDKRLEKQHRETSLSSLQRANSATVKISIQTNLEIKRHLKQSLIVTTQTLFLGLKTKFPG